MRQEEVLLLESVTVPLLKKAVRLSDISAGTFQSVSSRSGFKKMIKKGLIKLDGKIGTTGDYVKGGEIIDLYSDNNNHSKPEIPLKLNVLFEDQYLAIVNKPAGVVVSGNKRWTLENALSTNLKKSVLNGAFKRPEPIHRLDYPTSGALLVGKTSESVIRLNKMFEKRAIEKTYLAVIIGKPRSNITVVNDIDNKSAKTEFKIIHSEVSERFDFINLVELKPLSGRRHQLRKHMSEIGNPILGDKEYGMPGLILKGKGLYLHAESLKFIHPFTEERIEINAPVPKKFTKLFPEIIDM